MIVRITAIIVSKVYVLGRNPIQSLPSGPVCYREFPDPGVMDYAGHCWSLPNSHSHALPFFFLRFYLFTYLRERESGGMESDKQTCTERGARLGAQSQDSEIMTWAEIKSWVLTWLSHPGTPTHTLLSNKTLSPFKVKYPVNLHVTHDSCKADFIPIFRDWEKDFIEPKQIIHIPFPVLVDAPEVQINSMWCVCWGASGKGFLTLRNKLRKKGLIPFPDLPYLEIYDAWKCCIHLAQSSQRPTSIHWRW